MSEIYQIHLPDDVTYDIRDNSKVPQYTTMPTASSALVGRVVLYIGTTTEVYENGYFYKCVDNSGSYSWQMQNSASAISDLTDVDLTNLADKDVLVYDDDNDEWFNEGGHVKTVEITSQAYDALSTAEKNDPHIVYMITDKIAADVTINDTTTALDSVWSSSKTSSEISSRINAAIDNAIYGSY